MCALGRNSRQKVSKSLINKNTVNLKHLLRNVEGLDFHSNLRNDFSSLVERVGLCLLHAPFPKQLMPKFSGRAPHI